MQNQRDEVRLMGGDGSVTGALSAARYSTHKQETLLAEPVAVDYKQTPKANENLCHTLTHEGDGGIHSAVAYSDCLTPWDVQSKRIHSEDGVAPTLPSGGTEGMTIQPIVMASAHTNAEIGWGGSLLL